MYIPSAPPQSSSLSPEAGTIGQECPQCQQPQKPKIKKKKTLIQSYVFRMPTHSADVGCFDAYTALQHYFSRTTELSNIRIRMLYGNIM
jgi:hypothetical protein